jgi:hypothetical protein
MELKHVSLICITGGALQNGIEELPARLNLGWRTLENGIEALPPRLKYGGVG